MKILKTVNLKFTDSILELKWNFKNVDDFLYIVIFCFIFMPF